MIKRVTQLTVVPSGEPIFSENAFSIAIEDESGGEYLLIRSNLEGLENGTIALNPSEWPVLREAIDEMVNQCREDLE